MLSLAVHIPCVMCAGSVSGVFPTVYDPSGEILPPWAVAVVAAAISVTLLWIVSITLLVQLYESIVVTVGHCVCDNI